MRLRVLVLMHSELVPPASTRGMVPAETRRFKAEADVLDALEQLGHAARPLGVGDELLPIRRAVEEFRPDIVFNLLMDFHGVALYDAHVVSYLELLKVAYTGCNPRGLLLASDKPLAKKILTYHRVRVPRFVVCRRGRALPKLRGLAFPLFVKSPVEHASLGIAQASIVRDEAALRQRAGWIHEKMGTDAIAEEYIEGRELSLGLVGNQRLQALPLWEMTFAKLPRGTAPIATAQVKWDTRYQEKLGIETGPARPMPEGTAREAVRMGKRIFRALGMSGFARVDFRLRLDGKLFALEANPNPDLSADEDLAASAARAGLAFPALIGRILRLGLAYRAPWKEAGRLPG